MTCIECKDKCKYNDIEKKCENCRYYIVDNFYDPDPCDVCIDGSNFEYKVIPNEN